MVKNKNGKIDGIVYFVDSIKFITTIISMALNLYVIYKCLYKKRVRGLDIAHLIKLVFFNIFISLLKFSTSIIKWSTSYKVLNNSESNFCDLSGFLYTSAITSSMDIISVICLIFEAEISTTILLYCLIV